MDDSDAMNRMLPKRITVGVRTSVFVAMDADWRYDDSDLDPGGEWKERGFDDSGWLSGRALLGRETDALPKPFGIWLASPMEGDAMTKYFRTWFEYPGGDFELRLSTFIDDGAVFYINGREVHRVRVAEGQTHSSTASGGAGNANLETTTLRLPFAIPAGTNLLAAELHDLSPTSSDTVFGASLSFEPVSSVILPPEPPAPTLAIETDGAHGVRVHWDALQGSFVPGTALSPSGPWIAYPPSATEPPMTNADSLAFRNARYFRLREVPQQVDP